MSNTYKILAINPGSTSTKIAVYENEKKLYETNLMHDAKELDKFDDITDQIDFRKKAIDDYLKEVNFDKNQLKGIVSRGGGMHFIPDGGTYIVEDLMREHARQGVNGKHAASLGCLIGTLFARELSLNAYVVDPPIVDELEDIARVTGLPSVQRKSRLHVLNAKATARRAAESLGKTYETANIVVAHVGGGTSVSAHHNGRMIDVTDAQFGDGPFSGNRCGAKSADAIIDMCMSGNYTKKQMVDILTKNGGLCAHLGTASVLDANKMIEKGDKYAELVVNAMYYQIGKNIGAYSAVLKGKVDAIVLTGGVAYGPEFVDVMKDMVGCIAPIIVYPGEFEMEALALGCLRVLTGKEKPKNYVGEQDFDKLDKKYKRS